MIRILVVDDDGKVREVVAAMLAALGHTVLEAPDGLAAITMLEAKSAVDLVLTDLVMPGLSGWDLVKTIRRRWPLVRVAVVTGNHDIATAQAGQAVEFVIKKPFGLDTLQRGRVSQARSSPSARSLGESRGFGGGVSPPPTSLIKSISRRSRAYDDRLNGTISRGRSGNSLSSCGTGPAA